MLARVPEPEVMDTAEDAVEYDAMDHAGVNARFADDFFAFVTYPTYVLDVGTGTARIAILLLARAGLRAQLVAAADASAEMLKVAARNVAAAGVGERLALHLARAQALPFADGEFDQVISNSLLHHLPDPAAALPELVRVCADGGAIFVRDLVRPDTEAELSHLVETYAGGATGYQRRLFADSLRAALTVEELRAMVAALGLPASSVRRTSDRHLTWACRRA